MDIDGVKTVNKLFRARVSGQLGGQGKRISVGEKEDPVLTSPSRIYQPPRAKVMLKIPFAQAASPLQLQP